MTSGSFEPDFWQLPLRSESIQVRRPVVDWLVRPQSSRSESPKTAMLGADARSGMQKGMPPRTRGVRRFTYKDAKLHTRTGGVIIDEQFGRPTKGRPFTVLTPELPRILQSAAISSHDNVAVGYYAGWRNYYHWTTQCLLNIYLLQRCGVLSSYSLALPKSLGGGQRRTVELLGIPDQSILLTSPHLLQAKSLTVTDALYSTASISAPQQLSEMAATLRSRIRPTKALGRSKAIYISRVDASKRKMTNEDLLIRRLESLGIKHLSMGGKSVDDQIAAMQGARLIIAPHGAAVTNILYAPSDAFVYELLPSSYDSDCFEQLARTLGFGYTRDVFAASVPGRHDTVWAVEIDRVVGLTEKLLDIQAC